MNRTLRQSSPSQGERPAHGTSICQMQIKTLRLLRPGNLGHKGRIKMLFDSLRFVAMSLETVRLTLFLEQLRGLALPTRHALISRSRLRRRVAQQRTSQRTR